MENVEVLERVVNLEALLADFIFQTNKAILSMHRDREAANRDTQAFKEEMRVSRENSDREMKEFKDEMKEFKDEMKEFKDKMLAYREESQRDIKEMKQQWGALANKMGTLVEDIIAPAVRPVMQKFFGEEILFITINTRKTDKALNLKGEFDVIAASDSYVFVIETKSNPNHEYIDHFKTSKLPRFRVLFPEFKDLKLIPVFSTLRFEQVTIDYATRHGIYAMAYREWEYMDIINFENIQSI